MEPTGGQVIVETERGTMWRVATWSTVLWVPVVLGTLFATLWVLERPWGPYATPDVHGGERAWVLVGTGLTLLVAAVGARLLGRAAPVRRRGLAVGLGGSAAGVAVCAVCIAFVLLRWVS